jgi:PAS domain S-box-containing protein
VSKTGDEIEELAAQFNLMAAQLQESYASLEQRVRDRTRELETRNRELALLNRVIATTTSETEPEAILQTVCRELGQAFQLPEVGAALLNEEGTALTVIAEYRSEERPTALDVVMPVKGYPSAEYVLAHKAPLAVLDAQHDPLTAPVHDLMRARNAASLLILPLMVGGEIAGTLGLVSVERREFAEDEIALAMSVASAAAHALGAAWTRQRLIESQRMLSTLMDNLPGMVYRCRNDRDWTMEFVSDGCLELTGYAASDLVANNVLSYAEIIYPEDRERVWQTVQMALQADAPFEMVYRIVTADGKLKWVWEQGRGTLAPDGESLAVEGFITDITERTEALEALRRSEQMLSLHIQQTPLAYIEWSANLEVLDWNPSAERIFGYSKQEALNHHAYELIVPAEVQPHVTEVWQSILHQTGGTRSTNENVTREGRTIVCEWYNTPLIDQEGGVIGLASLVQDVTARVQAEEELREAKEAADEARKAAESANQAKSIFLANMSHELRTPLNAILGFSQLMDRDPALSVEHKESLDVITRSGEHLLTLINDVLELSKIEAGRTTVEPHGFDLHRMLDDLEDMFYLRAADKGLALITEYAPDVPQFVRADESKLRQVLINLLSNAVKFTNEGGVTLRARSVDIDSEEAEACASIQQSDRVSQSPCLLLQFQVEDTGIGIAPDDLATLFEPFVQAASGKDSLEGTGLGLPISQQFAHLMGGDITVKSRVDQGTIFGFDVPVELTEASQVHTEEPTRQVIGLAPDQPTFRLLVAEDRESNRKLLIRLLTSLRPSPGDTSGFEVREATNGLEALEIWQDWEPHLIWMDMRMPVMDGHEATKRIKATPKGQDTVVIALTASAFEEDRRAVLAEGCDDFVRKPFREADIFDKLTQHLGVRFVYEESGPAPSLDKPEEAVALLEERLTLETLEGLPEGWVDEVLQAALQADGGLVLELTQRIQTQYEPIANALTSLVRSYRFDAIVTLFEELGE